MAAKGRFWRTLVACGGIAPAAIGVFGGAGAEAQVVTREEVLRLPPVLRAAVSEFGAEKCPADKVDALRSGEEPLTTLSGLSLEEPGVVPESLLAADWNDLIGKPVSRDGISRIAARIECRYREQGFVFARASIDGEAATGAYRARVREGVVANVEVAAGGDALAALVLKAFSSVREGRPLNAADVRLGLVTSASVGVANVRPTVRRARGNPDAIDLILVAEAPANQAFTQVQNYNIKSLGPWGALAGVRVHGLSPLHERSQLGVYASTDGEEQRALQGSSEALITAGGVKARVEGAYARTKPGDLLAPLDVDGETAFAGFSVSRPVLVRRGLFVSADAGFEAIEQQTEFLGGTTLNKDHLRIVTAGLRLDGIARGVVWGTSLQARKGVSSFGASDVQDRFLSRADADPQAALYRADVEVAAKIGKMASVRAIARGQHSNDSLAAFEEFNFGALSGGRGFDAGALNGDKGVAGSIEAASRPVSWKGQIGGQPYVFVDAARLWNEGNAVVRRSDGVSAGAGVRFDLFDRARLDLTYAEPVGNVRGAPNSVAGARVLAQLSASFDWSFANGFGRGAR